MKQFVELQCFLVVAKDRLRHGRETIKQCGEGGFVKSVLLIVVHAADKQLQHCQKTRELKAHDTDGLIDKAGQQDAVVGS